MVILGPTGRNIAAGMSGGVAYVLDLNEERVNPEMVDIEAVGADTSEWLAAVVRQHGEETDSAVARELLGDWATAVKRFRQIMPRDYRRALAAIAAAEAEGRDPIEAVMEAARG